MAKDYETPQVRLLGTVQELTNAGGGDKVGSVDDEFTQLTGLDGFIIPGV